MSLPNQVEQNPGIKFICITRLALDTKRAAIRYWRYGLLLSFFLLMILPCSSGQLPQPWKAAEAAYEKGNFKTAAAYYESLVQQGYRDPALYFNLGKSYAQLGKKGMAILAFERALRLDPDSEIIPIALTTLREQLIDQVDPQEVPFTLRWISFIAPGNWAVIAIAACWLAGIFWYLSGNIRFNRQRLVFSALGCALLGLLAFAIALYADAAGHNPQTAIVLQAESRVRIAPDIQSPELRLLHEGTKVHIADQLAQWVKIRLENGDEGWMPLKDVERITDTKHW